MKRVDIKIRFGCNNMCRFCVQGDKRSRFADKTLSRIKSELKEGLASGAEGLVLTGGEPTLHAGICEIAQAAKKMGYKKVQLQTNGRRLCYKNFCEDLLAAGVDEFSPALHGSTPEIHDFLTGAPGSFAQTVKGIMNLKSLGKKVVTNSVVTKVNYKNLPALAKLLVSLRVDQFQFAFVHILGSAAKNRKTIVPRISEAAPWIKKALDAGIKAAVSVMTEAVPFCLMAGYEKYVAERYIPETMIFDADFKVDRFSYYRRHEGKAKGPLCAECRWDKVCEGPWKEYPEIFGWDEFKPAP